MWSTLTESGIVSNGDIQMRYMGSKARHAKHIVPILMDGHDQDKPYVEPFVGGGNMIDKVPAKIRWGSDVAEYAVALLAALSKGWEPPECLTEREYHDIKQDPENYPNELVGFAGYCCSYSGKLWGGYGRNGNPDKYRKQFQYEAHLNVIKQSGGLSGVLFTVSSYLAMDIPDGSTVYMDPPYAGTTKYKSGGFNHDEFWGYCSDLSTRCRVFVSEYAAPDGWECVWEKEVTNSLTKDTGAKRGVEKLFTLKP